MDITCTGLLISAQSNRNGEELNIVNAKNQISNYFKIFKFLQFYNSIILYGIAKLSPSSSFSWAELALISISPHPTTHPTTHPPTRESSKTWNSAFVGIPKPNS